MVVLEKTLESPLDCKEIQPVHSKGDQSWVFFGRTDAKAETPVLWPPDVKSWLIGKDFDAGRDWEQEEKGTTEDEMSGWHHWLDGRETTDWFQIGKGVCQGYILSSCLFNLYTEYITRNARLDEAQAGIKIAGRNISNTDDTTYMAESKEVLKNSW